MTRKPFFQKPFYPETDPWTALSSSERELWKQWSDGNPTADTDFQSKFRDPKRNFFLISENYSATFGAWTTLPTPLGSPSFQGTPILVNAQTWFGDIYAKLRLSKDVDQLTTALIWAGSYRAVGAEVNLYSLRFIAQVSWAAGSHAGDQSANWLPNYEAVWGDASSQNGKVVDVFAFEYSEGQLQFNRGFPCPLVML